MADTTSKTCKFDWLYPELLSKEGLIEILSQRFVKLPENVEATPKEELLELYCKYILPRPQRQYRHNRRGREMIRKQIAMAKKRKIMAPDSSEPPAKRVTNASPRLLTSFDGRCPSARLKPPPSCDNLEKKIKLNSLKSAAKSTFSTSVVSSNSSDASPLSKKKKLNSSSPAPPAGEVASASPAPKLPQVNKITKVTSSHLSSLDVNEKAGAPNSTENNNVSKNAPTVETSPEASEKSKRKFEMQKISWP